MCLAALTHCHGGFADGEQPITLSMCGHSVDTFRYCVSQEKVIIHLPVSRLLAGEPLPGRIPSSALGQRASQPSIPHAAVPQPFPLPGLVVTVMVGFQCVI